MQAMVVAAGDPDPRDAALLDSADLLIAVDRGAVWLSDLQRRPDLLVGDLDSVPEGLVAGLGSAGAEIDRYSADKDASDTELAIHRAVAMGATRVTLLGALGGQRLDHELANLLLLADPRWRSRLADLRIVRGGTTARALHGGATLALEGVIGTTVTLLPVGGDVSGVRTTGLRFPLDGEALGLGRTRGLSNRIVAIPASVSLERGTLIVIEQKPEEE
jgi:thiamine pyrophosphokinase